MVEREGKLLACAMLRPLGQSDDGVGCAEIAAFCVHPAYRGSGRGDNLLDFLGARALRPTLAHSKSWQLSHKQLYQADGDHDKA